MPEMIAKLVTVRIRATGQVSEFLPEVARSMLASGVAEEVTRSAQPESAMVRPAQEKAVSQVAARARSARR
jgi:hypothetical protein